MWQCCPIVLSSTYALPKTREVRSHWLCQAITTSRVGLLLIAKSNNNNVAPWDNHLFLPLIALSNAKMSSYLTIRLVMLPITRSNDTHRLSNKLCQHWLPPILGMAKAPQDECDQSHHNNQPSCQRLALMGKKSSSDVMIPVRYI